MGLGRLTGLDYSRVFRVARRGQEIRPPTYVFMTDEVRPFGRIWLRRFVLFICQPVGIPVLKFFLEKIRFWLPRPDAFQRWIAQNSATPKILYEHFWPRISSKKNPAQIYAELFIGSGPARSQSHEKYKNLKSLFQLHQKKTFKATSK